MEKDRGRGTYFGKIYSKGTAGRSAQHQDGILAHDANTVHTDGLRCPAHAHEHGVHRAIVGEQGKEEHGESRGHDEVWHIDNGLEKGLALQLQPQVGEPCCQQQGDGDLRDEADDPQDQGVAEILGQIGGKQGDVVFQARKIGADDFQAAAVILKKAVINGGDQRDQLKYRKDDEERRNEDIAPFCLADRPFLFRLFSHKDRLLS